MGSSICLVKVSSQRSKPLGLRPYGELQAWMKMTWLPTWQHVVLEELFGGEVSWATSNFG